jgi:hypothetical protein
MKSLAIGLAALLLGFLSGRLFSEASVTSEGGNEQEPVVTFQGEASTGLSATDVLSTQLSGSRYTRADFLARLEEANRTNDPLMRKAILSEWALRESADGIRAVFAIGNRLEGWQLLATWTSHHPGEAAKMARELATDLDDSKWRDSVLRTALKQLLLTDPDQAVALERSLRGNPYGYGDFSEGAVSRGTSPQTILATLSQFRSPTLKRGFLLTLQSEGLLSPLEVIQWSEEHMPLGDRRNLEAHVLREWVEGNAAEAGAYVTSKLDGSWESRSLTQRFLGQLAQQSPDEVLAWLKKQDRDLISGAAPMRWGSLSDEKRRAIAAKLGPDFPEFAPDFEARPYDGMTPQNLPASWPPKTATEAKAWLEHSDTNWINPFGPEQWTVDSINDTLALLPETPTRSKQDIASQLARQWVRHDPKQALTWASNLPDEDTITVAESALGEWFKLEPTSAREYVEKMPSGEFRGYAVELITQGLWLKDPNSAEQWVDQLAEGFEKDIGRRNIASVAVISYPERAYSQAIAMRNPVMREEWVERSLRFIAIRDPTLALELLPDAGLPPEIAAEIRKSAGQPDPSKK